MDISISIGMAMVMAVGIDRYIHSGKDMQLEDKWNLSLMAAKSQSWGCKLLSTPCPKGTVHKQLVPTVFKIFVERCQFKELVQSSNWLRWYYRGSNERRWSALLEKAMFAKKTGCSFPITRANRLANSFSTLLSGWAAPQPEMCPAPCFSPSAHFTF